MKYKIDERLEIGRLIYEGELSKADATKKFGISTDTARHYMRFYRNYYDLPAMPVRKKAAPPPKEDKLEAVRERLKKMKKKELLEIIFAIQESVYLPEVLEEGNEEDE